MKRILFIAFSITLILACTSKEKPTGYFLTGKVAAFDTGYVYIEHRVDGEMIKIDSVLSSKGNFMFTGKVEFPQFIFLTFGDKKYRSGFFLENSNIQFDAHIDSLGFAKVTGSQSNNLLKQYEDELLPFENKMKNLNELYLQAEKERKQGSISQIDSAIRILNFEQQNFIWKYIVNHKNSVVIPYILSRDLAYLLDVNELDSIISQIDTSLNQSIYLVGLKKQIEVLKSVEIGKVAPDFTLNDTAGVPLSLSSFKGKYLLIDFWASWCGDCRKEIPNIVKIYADYHPKGLEILGVSFDQNKEDWINAIRKYNLNWVHVSDLKRWKSTAGKLYGVRSIPHTVLLNKQGIIVAKNLNGNDLKLKVSELLDKK